MYKDVYHPQVKKDIKKLDIQVKNDILITHIDMILSNPYKYDVLSGNFQDIYSYHFKKNNVDYRICYTIKDDEKVVYFLMIGKRENLYTQLQRRIH